MKPYETPAIKKLYCIAAQDVITTSGDSPVNSTNDKDTDAGWGEQW